MSAKSDSQCKCRCFSCDLLSEAVEPTVRQFLAFEVVTACLEDVGSDLGELLAVWRLLLGSKLAHEELGQAECLSDRRTLLPYLHLLIVGVALALVAFGDVTAEGARVGIHLRADRAGKSLALSLCGLRGRARVLLRLCRLYYDVMLRLLC